MSLSGWAQALTDCSFQPASSPTSNPEAPPCKMTSLMMMHDSGCHGPLRWWWWGGGDFFVSQLKLLGNEKPRPPELQTSSRNLCHSRFNGPKKEKWEERMKWMLAVRENRLRKLISEFPAAHRMPQTSQSPSSPLSIIFLLWARGIRNTSHTPLDGYTDTLTKELNFKDTQHPRLWRPWPSFCKVSEILIQQRGCHFLAFLSLCNPFLLCAIFNNLPLTPESTFNSNKNPQ